MLQLTYTGQVSLERVPRLLTRAAFSAAWCSLLLGGMVAGTLFIKVGTVLGQAEDWCERKLK